MSGSIAAEQSSTLVDYNRHTIWRQWVLVLGPLLALPQWVVLRRHVVRAGWWIPGNAVAWTLGMPVIFIGMGLIPTGDVTVTTIAIVLLSLAVTGAVVGMVHGVVLLWLLKRRDKT